MRYVVLFALSAWTVWAGEARSQAHEGHSHDHAGRGSAVLGKVSFENSGNSAAQTPFHHGLALLHSFEYTDAADAFLEAQRADPDLAIAYWMEALTTEHPLWGEYDTEKAHSILSRLGASREARLAKARTPRERMYGVAIEALFASDSREVRFLAFADSVRALAEAYPQDLEAVAFASIASLAAAQFKPSAERAAMIDAAIAGGERVFALNPQHPGAAHYLIHAYDTPSRAAQGLPFARAYADIAPDAEHALHMPSHIFMQLGLWDDAAASNERAWAASRAWVQRRGLTGAHLDFHSLSWLQYAYLQQGRHAAARAIIDTARAVLSNAGDDRSGGPDPLTAVTRLAFQYAAETGDWTIELLPRAAGLELGTTPRYEFFARLDAFQRSVIGLMRGAEADSPAAADTGRGLLSLQIRAVRARARGDSTEWRTTLRQAIEVENGGDAVGPPLALVSHDLLAASLLAAGDAADAATVYEASLERRPRRPAALLGLARARAAAGDRAGSTAAYATLREVWHAADPDLAASARMRDETSGR